MRPSRPGGPLRPRSSADFGFYKEGGQLVDDHLFINEIIGIPTLDIIHYDARQNTGFGDFWHTHNDNMETIDKKTLKAVGETVCQVVMDL